MSRFLLTRLSYVLQRLENLLPELFGRGFPPEALCVASIQHSPLNEATSKSSFSIKDLIGDGFLWAVPKSRRTIEKRLKRKFGWPEYHYKLLQPKTNLQICNTCGHNHEIGVLCPNCYEKIRKETEQMQEKIQEKLGLDPVEKEVIVLYEGEKGDHSPEFFHGKRVIEMEKPRPMWFSKNLMQKSTQQPDETKEVKPDKLG